MISERTAQAHRLHQFRVAARLTIAEAASLAGLTEDEWFQIEYRGAGRVAQIRRLIASLPGPHQKLGRVLSSEEALNRRLGNARGIGTKE